MCLSRAMASEGGMETGPLRRYRWTWQKRWTLTHLCSLPWLCHMHMLGVAIFRLRPVKVRLNSSPPPRCPAPHSSCCSEALGGWNCRHRSGFSPGLLLPSLLHLKQISGLMQPQSSSPNSVIPSSVCVGLNPHRMPTFCFCFLYTSSFI
jgi:hypothetical protein